MEVDHPKSGRRQLRGDRCRPENTVRQHDRANTASLDTPDNLHDFRMQKRFAAEDADELDTPLRKDEVQVALNLFKGLRFPNGAVVARLADAITAPDHV